MRYLATKLELECLQELCRSHNLRYSAWPTDSGLFEMKIRYKDGDELSADVAFIIGQNFESKVRRKREVDFLSRLQQPPSNVFQPLEDLLP